MVSGFQVVKRSNALTIVVAILLCFASRYSLGQDLLLQQEAVWANSDCFRNYDASIESTVIADLPNDPKELEKLEAKFRADRRSLWDEKQQKSRVVITNEPPIQLLFVSEWIYIRNGKSIDRIARMVHWCDVARYVSLLQL